MGMHSDRIIGQKINAVQDLPDGYEPNLTSKWELLDTGLRPQRKNNPWLVWRVSAVAAMLLCIGGAGLFWIKHGKTVTQANVTAVPPFKVEPNDVAAVKPEISPEKKIRKHKKARIKTNTPQVIEIPEENSIAESEVIMPEEELYETTMAEIPETKKTERYMEADFTGPVINAGVPHQAIVKAQKFRFRLGFTGGASQAGVDHKSKNIRVSTSF